MALLIGCVVAASLPTAALAETTSPKQARSATGDSALALPAAWHYSGGYSTPEDCNFVRVVRQAQGYPTNPTSGCYRNTSEYYFYWWG